MPTPIGRGRKADGTGTGAAHANSCLAATAFSLAFPIFDGGETFDGCAMEPVISDEGRSALACSRAEWDEQPDTNRQTETITDEAQICMRTRTQDNLGLWMICKAYPRPPIAHARLARKIECDLYKDENGSVRQPDFGGFFRRQELETANHGFLRRMNSLFLLNSAGLDLAALFVRNAPV